MPSELRAVENALNALDKKLGRRDVRLDFMDADREAQDSLRAKLIELGDMVGRLK